MSAAQVPSCYLSPALVARNASHAKGRGVFARQPLAPGELLVTWGGCVLPWPIVESMSARERRLCLQIEEDLFLYSECEGPADWINHSCDPNAGLSGQITLVAMRAIEPEEEITFDYCMSDSRPYDEFTCHCGADTCRGRIAADDWKRPELQQRYAGYFSPYLQRKIETLQRAG